MNKNSRLVETAVYAIFMTLIPETDIMPSSVIK